MGAALRNKLSLTFMFLLAFNLQAQEILMDTTQTAKDSALTLSEEIVEDSFHPKDFKRAILWASTLPGAGQAYNEKYWKMPIVYGGLGGITYWLVSGVKDFRCYRSALRALNDADPSNDLGCNGFTSSNALQLKRESSRRQIDYGALLLSLGYALQIMDAAVDARLSHFQVDDNLLLRWNPMVLPSPVGTPIVGLSVSLHLE
jgi:hypothetical protein